MSMHGAECSARIERDLHELTETQLPYRDLRIGANVTAALPKCSHKGVPNSFVSSQDFAAGGFLLKPYATQVEKPNC